MNDPGFRSSSSSDAILDGLLASLRQIEPSLESRVRNRIAIADELRRLQMQMQRRDRPWWRRSVSIPAPIAAALVILVGLSLAWSYRNRAGRFMSPGGMPQRVDWLEHENTNRLARARVTPEAEYSASEIYLCGVGRVESVSGYFIREDNQ